MFENVRVISFAADKCDDGITVGELLRKNGVSRRLMVKLKRAENGITRFGEHMRTIDRVKAGDVISLKIADEKLLDANPALSAAVAYEDDDVAVFDKPADMPVHPSAKHREDTLGNCFSAMYDGLAFRPINRLDKDTSGLCAVAKNPHAANVLQNEVKKVYYAVVCGKISEDGVIDAPIARAADSVIKRVVREDGQRAVTEYHVIKGNEKYTLLKIILHTGRTHQIRVHFAYIGHPLAGDDFYGGSCEDIEKQALHCGELKFKRVCDGKPVTVVSELREDIKKLLVTSL